MELDAIDRGLIYALNIDGRASFSKIADVLGVSDQTVARRYRQLRATNTARVVGLALPWRVGETRWYLRVRCAPDVSVSVASALAMRSDTYWVRMLSGGTEIDCVVQCRAHQEPGNLLLQKLPKTQRVLDVSAHSLLHAYVGGPVEQSEVLSGLTKEQVSALRPKVRYTDEIVPLDDADYRMLAALERDGRVGFADLAKVTGWSESTAKRRVDFLRETGALYFDVDMDMVALGYPVEARLWMAVPPAQLAEVGRALAKHPEVVFAAATTGSRNLMASVVFRTVPAFYRYLTEKLGTLRAVENLETAPVIRTLKRGATLLINT
ncbi:Lrp/AsnC family transcriptional regulator [Actinocrispum wychmicini]|uniref:Lrp/AsnC family transcriptional regulator n=1 Tax=Actinocrispum wychmicini TaxID=1213861 RepID=UPI001FB78A6A|nr:AsnC family transcriptional regulator [Actinocrispum wychmicini]